MTSDEVIRRVRESPNRRALSRETGLPYNYLCRLAEGRIREPGAHKVDVLRDHFERAIQPKGRAQ